MYALAPWKLVKELRSADGIYTKNERFENGGRLFFEGIWGVRELGWSGKCGQSRGGGGARRRVNGGVNMFCVTVVTMGDWGWFGLLKKSGA
jgi:hypothetical protein